MPPWPPTRRSPSSTRQSTVSSPIEAVHDPGLVAHLAQRMGPQRPRPWKAPLRSCPTPSSTPAFEKAWVKRPCPTGERRRARPLRVRHGHAAGRGHLRRRPWLGRRGVERARHRARGRALRLRALPAAGPPRRPRSVYGGYCYFNNAAIVASGAPGPRVPNGSRSSTSTTTTATAPSSCSTAGPTCSTCRCTPTRTAPTPTSPATRTRRAPRVGAGRR